jgi:hypothetical protein
VQLGGRTFTYALDWTEVLIYNDFNEYLDFCKLLSCLAVMLWFNLTTDLVAPCTY